MTRRLLLSYLTVTVLVLVLLEVPLAIFYAQRERERITANVERDAYVIATIYEDDLQSGLPTDPRPAEEYTSNTGARVVVVDSLGISQVDTEQVADRDFSTRPEIIVALGGNRSTGIRPSETLGTDLLFVAIPVASGGTVHGAVRLTIDTGEVDARIQRFWWALAAVAAVVVAAVALIGTAIARSVTRPLRELEVTAGRFAGGDLRVDDGAIEGPPEIQRLAGTMASMAQRLDAQLEAQRSFVADASHQLRTPLTALRLRLENLRSDATESQAVEIDAAIDETTRLAGLVTDLLRLARSDALVAVGVADLTGLTADRLDTWTAVAETAGVGFEHTAPDSPVLVRSVPGAIEQILDNLLDNAVTATPRGGVVRVAVERTDGHAELRVSDDGPGLDDEQKANALRRFWRGTTATPGTGLGLAIVESLASASGGTVGLDDAPGGGLLVTVTLRLADRADPPRGHPSVPLTRA